MDLISTTEALRRACARLAAHPFVTVDTEFLRETTYYPLLCVVQMASADEAVVIDTLAEGDNIVSWHDDDHKAGNAAAAERAARRRNAEDAVDVASLELMLEPLDQDHVHQ